MKKVEVSRPYQSLLLPNHRKFKYLDETWNAYKSVKSLLHRFLVCAYGAVPFNKFVEVVEKVDNDQLVLAFAVRLFRLVPVESTSFAKVDKANLAKSLANHLPVGTAIPANVQSYFDSNFDPKKYMWIDCAWEADRLAREMGLSASQFSEYATTMLWEDWLPLNKDDVNGWGSVSGLFGEGKKEDRQQKVKMLNNLLNGIKKNPPKDYTQYLKILLNAFDAKSHKEAVKNYKGDSTGRTASYLSEKSGEITELMLEQLMSNIQRDIGDKQKEISLPKKDVVKKYLESESGVPYDQNLWSQAYRNAASSIKKTDTRNFNSTLEKFKNEVELRGLLSEGDDVEILRSKFFSSEFHKTPDKFVIKPEHIGFNNKYNVVAELYKLKAEATDFESAFATVKDEFEEKGIKHPIKNILEYIWNNEVPVEKWGRVARFNQSEEKLLRIKANPTVECNQGMTFGNSAMVGEVLRSNYVSKKGALVSGEHGGRLIGQNNMIWLEMRLLNKGKWETHHVPTHNMKFFEEVHAYNPSLADSVNVRNRLYRSEDYTQLPSSITDGLKGNPKAKLLKRQHCALNNMTANVLNPKLSFTINKKNDDYTVIIVHSVEVSKPRREVLVGDYLVGMDQNQTASNTYAVMQVVKPKSTDAIPFRNMWVRFVESGSIESRTLNSRGEYVDQLNHDGVDLFEIGDTEWVDSARKFFNKLGVKHKDGTLVDLSTAPRKAYAFNNFYFKTMLNHLRSNEVDLTLLRNEILRVANGRFSPMRLGSLSWTTLKALGSFKSLVLSYFDRLGAKEMVDKEAKDKSLFDLLVAINNKRSNKREERTSRIASSLMTVAQKYKVDNAVVHVVVEGNLSSTDRSASKAHNRNTMDWCSRAVVKKLEDMCNLYGFNIKGVPAFYTSHQDPLVHRADYDDPKPALRCRYSSYSRADFSKWGQNALAAVVRWASNKKSNTCYKVGAVEFLKQHGLFADKKLTVEQFLSKVKDEEILIPRRGGRVFLTTHRLLAESTFVYLNGVKYHSCNADEVAAVNICLNDWVIPCKKKMKEESSASG